MDPVTIGLVAMSALGKLGGIFGAKKRTQLSPEMLKSMFGAKAITDEQMELFNRAMNSSVGQQLMTSAAQQGQEFQTNEQRAAAEAGLGPSGGASGGADVFAGAAGASAQGNLQRSMQSSLMQSMLPIAQQLVSDRMQAWLRDRDQYLGQTTRFQDIMGAVSGLGGDLLAARAGSQPGQTTMPSSNDPTAPNFMGPSQPSPTAMTPQAGSATGQQPVGTAPVTGVQPAGTQAAISPPKSLAMPDMTMQGSMPGMRDQGLRTMFTGGGGRFARAMSMRNRFGAVQPSGGF